MSRSRHSRSVYLGSPKEYSPKRSSILEPVKSSIGEISSKSSAQALRFSGTTRTSRSLHADQVRDVQTCAIFAYDFLLAGTNDRLLTMSVETVILRALLTMRYEP